MQEMPSLYIFCHGVSALFARVELVPVLYPFFLHLLQYCSNLHIIKSATYSLYSSYLVEPKFGCLGPSGLGIIW